MSVLLDEETVVLEGLDFEAPCEHSEGHAAQRVVRIRCCRAGITLCTAHVDLFRDWVEHLIANLFTMCGLCGAPVGSWDDYEVVPL